jgi:hypothetical protein
MKALDLKLEALARRATQCRECFALREVDAPTIDIAQPVWVGSGSASNASSRASRNKTAGTSAFI